MVELGQYEIGRESEIESRVHSCRVGFSHTVTLVGFVFQQNPSA